MWRLFIEVNMNCILCELETVEWRTILGGQGSWDKTEQCSLCQKLMYWYDDSHVLLLQARLAAPATILKAEFETVGCVAMDIYGNCAAATSTGGFVNKMVGRIGKLPPSSPWHYEFPPLQWHSRYHCSFVSKLICTNSASLPADSIFSGEDDRNAIDKGHKSCESHNSMWNPADYCGFYWWILLIFLQLHEMKCNQLLDIIRSWPWKVSSYIKLGSFQLGRWYTSSGCRDICQQFVCYFSNWQRRRTHQRNSGTGSGSCYGV